MDIKLSEVEKVIWLQFESDGVPYYKVQLARVLRDYLEPEYSTDKARGDKWNTEQAFKKVSLLESLKSELKRA